MLITEPSKVIIAKDSEILTTSRGGSLGRCSILSMELERLVQQDQAVTDMIFETGTIDLDTSMQSMRHSIDTIQNICHIRNQT